MDCLGRLVGLALGSNANVLNMYQAEINDVVKHFFPLKTTRIGGMETDLRALVRLCCYEESKETKIDLEALGLDGGG